MGKVSIVAPIGTSPPVITEFIQYVERVLDQTVTDVTIITTREPLVMQGLELVKAAVADRYPRTRVHVVELPYDDIDTEEKSMDFFSVAASVLRHQKEKYGADIVLLCVAGGRKEVCIILSLLAQFYKVNGVYHIVMSDVKAFNVDLERIRYEAEMLSKTEDKLGYYRQKKDLLEPVLFPKPHTYNVIKIPVIPYPKDALMELKQALKQRKFKSDSIDANVAFQLSELGYIRISRDYAFTLPDGERLLRVIESVVS